MTGEQKPGKPKKMQININNSGESVLKEPWDTVDSSIQEIKEKEVRVDYKKMLDDTQILFLGEDHSNTSIRNHLLNRVTELKEAGITHYAIEANEEGRQIFERLNNGENVDLSGVDIGPGGSDYEAVIRAMIAQGIKVVPIDINQNNNPTKESREARITDNLTEILETNPGAKIVSLIGAFHTSKQKSLLDGFEMTGARLKIKGVKVTTVLFCGGKIDRTGPKMLTAPIEKAGMQNKEFAIDFRGYTNEKYIPFGKGEADFVIHLPQTY